MATKLRSYARLAIRDVSEASRAGLTMPRCKWKHHIPKCRYEDAIGSIAKTGTYAVLPFLLYTSGIGKIDIMVVTR